MSDVKHTPGPWKVEGSIYKHMHSEIVSAMPGAERGISQVWKHDNAMADARLMAAAPDLLEALIALRADCMGMVPDCAEQVDAAIAKATRP